jgi:hypothetical protein
MVPHVYEPESHVFASAIAVAVILSLIILGANLYGRYLHISRGKTALLLLAAVLAAVGFGVWRANVLERTQAIFNFGDRDLDEALPVGFAALLPLAAVPFLAKLYLTWIAGAATDAEKAPGMEGVRAWLRGGNLVCAVLISICLWLGFGYSFWAPVALALMALLAFPILNMVLATSAPQAPAPNTNTLAPERERVLKMLDDGKITAQESAELLNALGHTAQPRAPQSTQPPHRRLVWIGAAVLLVGFFLPWFTVNTVNFRQAMNDMTRQMPMAQGMPNLGGMMPQGGTLYIAAGDIPHGLGWCVLVLGIVAAVLPFMAANLDSQTCQKACLVALGAGAIILLYLFTQNLRFVGVGILLGLAGYALEFVGVLKARQLDWSRAI